MAKKRRLGEGLSRGGTAQSLSSSALEGYSRKTTSSPPPPSSPQKPSSSSRRERDEARQSGSDYSVSDEGEGEEGSKRQGEIEQEEFGRWLDEDMAAASQQSLVPDDSQDSVEDRRSGDEEHEGSPKAKSKKRRKHEAEEPEKSKKKNRSSALKDDEEESPDTSSKGQNTQLSMEAEDAEEEEEDRDSDDDDKSDRSAASSPADATQDSKKKKKKKRGPTQSIEAWKSTDGFKNAGVRRKWILPREDGEEGFYVNLVRKSSAPIVKDLADARQVVEWFKETGYIGVKERADGKGFDSYIIVNGTIQVLSNVYETAEEAAKAHDEHVIANRLKYLKNFRVIRGNVDDPTEAKRFNRSADIDYSPSVHKVEFIHNNIIYTKNLLIRLAEDPKVESTEIWRNLEKLLQFVTWWGVGSQVFMRFIRDASDALRVAFRIGDRQLRREATGAVSPHEDMAPGEREQREESVRKKLLKERLHWVEGVFEQLQHMYITLTHRRYPKQALEPLRWGVEVLRHHASLLTMTKSNEAKLEAFGDRLEEMENHPLWKHHSDFYCLRGEYLLSLRTDVSRMRQAQRLFARSLKLDPNNSRAMLFLTTSEHIIHEVQSATMDDQLVSISQRTTQDMMSQEELHESSDDEESDGDNQGDRKKKKKKKKATKDADSDQSTMVMVTQRINEAIQNHPGSVMSWLALEGLLFVETSELDTKEVREKKRICLIRLIELLPTLSSKVIERLDRLWGLTKGRRQEKIVDFFWTLVVVAESLTQKECPTYFTHYSTQSLPVWEYLVTCLKSLPSGTISFDEKRQRLWRRRFFPNTLGFMVDPFAFFHDRVHFSRHNIAKWTPGIRPHHYLGALRAMVALLTGVEPSYHTEVVKKMGRVFVEDLCPEQAIQACERRADASS